MRTEPIRVEDGPAKKNQTKTKQNKNKNKQKNENVAHRREILFCFVLERSEQKKKKQPEEKEATRNVKKGTLKRSMWRKKA